MLIFDINLRSIFSVLEVIAIFAFALSGLFIARTHRLDVVGTFIAAFLAAFGGGTLRDVLLNQGSFYWVEHSGILWGVFLMALLASLTLRISSRWLSDRIILIADAIGLGIFSVTGTWAAWQHNWPPLPCVMIGVITATFGGLLRDLVCNQKPMLISDPTPYASIAFMGNWLFLGMMYFQVTDLSWATALVSLCIAAVRVVLAILEVKLPQLQ